MSINSYLSARQTTSSSSQSAQGMLTREMLDVAFAPKHQAIEEGLLNTGLCALVSEPQTGKTAMAKRLCDSFARSGAHTRFLDLANAPAESVSGKIFRVSRDISSYHPNQKSLVCIDSMPVLDYPYEDDVARAIRGLAERGVSVLLTMRPEAASLLDGLPNASVFGASEITFDYDGLSRGTGDEALAMSSMQLTNGIPALLASLCGEEPALGPGVRYWRTLERVVALSLRKGLMAEELRLRCAMLLLGTGEFDDIEEVCGEVDESLLADTAREAPLFGVDVRTGTFRCVGSHDPKGIESCVRSLRDALAPWREVSRRTIWLLIRRGDFARAASVGWISPNIDDAIALVSNPVDYINVGESTRLADAIQVIETTPGMMGSDASEALQLSKLALASIGRESLSEEQEATALGFGGTRRFLRQQGQVRGLLACDLATREVSHRLLEHMPEEEDRLARDLCLHARALSLISEGRFEQAFRILLGVRAPDSGHTLSRALLAMDYETASMLVGDTSGLTGQESIAQAEFLAESGFDVIATVFRATRPSLHAILGIETDTLGIERAIVSAQSKGMHVYVALFLLAASVADLTSAVNTRAHVRATAAESAATLCGSTFLARSARLVDDIALRRMGGVPRVIGRPSRATQYEPTAFDVVEQLYISARKVKRPKLASEERVVLSNPCPRDILCLLDVLLREGGEVGLRLASTLPDTWRTSVSEFGGRMRDVVSGGHGDWPVTVVGKSVLLDSIRHANIASCPPDSVLEISLLGGFSLRYGGLLVDPKGLDRRKAKALLTLLAAKRGHQLGRGEAVDAFWPGGDYINVRQKVYEATSSIRRAMKTVSVPDNFLISEFGSISLNPTCVVCDTDVVEDIGIEMLANDGNDQRLLTLGSAMAKVYAGDLYCPPNETSGLMIARREELRNIFIDSMLLATRAALRLGLNHKAAEFSRKALNNAPIREDVMIERMRALHAAGRSNECSSEYERFFRLTVASTGEPPAAIVRNLARELHVTSRGGES